MFLIDLLARLAFNNDEFAQPRGVWRANERGRAELVDGGGATLCARPHLSLAAADAALICAPAGRSWQLSTRRSQPLPVTVQLSASNSELTMGLVQRQLAARSPPPSYGKTLEHLPRAVWAGARERASEFAQSGASLPRAVTSCPPSACSTPRRISHMRSVGARQGATRS